MQRFNWIVYLISLVWKTKHILFFQLLDDDIMEVLTQNKAEAE